MSQFSTVLLMFSLLTTIVLNPAFAAPLRDDESTTVADLTRRVRVLEQAVTQLQQQCGSNCTSVSINTPATTTTGEIWTCKVAGRKDVFYGEGQTRGSAEKAAMEECYSFDSFCKVEECSN